MPAQQLLHGGQVTGDHNSRDAQHDNEVGGLGAIRPADALRADAYGDVHGIQGRGAAVRYRQPVVQIGGLRFFTQEHGILDMPGLPFIKDFRHGIHQGFQSLFLCCVGLECAYVNLKIVCHRVC